MPCLTSGFLAMIVTPPPGAILMNAAGVFLHDRAAVARPLARSVSPGEVARERARTRAERAAGAALHRHTGKGPQ